MKLSARVKMDIRYIVVKVFPMVKTVQYILLR